eukprot:COSAG02_NODE_2067_length_9945_cov_24.620150_6_plen_130_part_00
MVTSQRLLLLSCQPTTGASINVNGKPHMGYAQGSVALTYKAANSVSYRPVSLANIRSIAMLMETATEGVAVVNKQARQFDQVTWCCLNFFDCFALCCSCHCCNDLCQNTWRGTTSHTAKNQRCKYITAR